VTFFPSWIRELMQVQTLGTINLISDSMGGCELLTCHDEYLLASMVQGIDGALVGFNVCAVPL
jgi:hypothetical protein